MKSAAFSRDSAFILTGSTDNTGNTARIWDAKSGKEIAALSERSSSGGVAAFSPDEKRVVTARAGHIWDVHFATMSTNALIVEVCTRRLRGLTTLSRDEIRLAGYPDTMPPIDICAGIN